jgi:hypothetical protein
MRKNPEETRDEMSRLIDEWRTSGRTATAFAAENGITRAKFEYWKARLGVREGTGRRVPGFVPVQLVGEGRAGCEVVLANGNRLVIREAVSLELLQGLIGALREDEC